MSYYGEEEYHGEWMASGGELFYVIVRYRVDESRSTDEYAFVQSACSVYVASNSLNGVTIRTSWGQSFNVSGGGKEYASTGYGDSGLVKYGSRTAYSVEAYTTDGRYSSIIYTDYYYEPAPPSWAAKAVTGFTATRERDEDVSGEPDSEVLLAWSNTCSVARPYETMTIERSTDGGDWTSLKVYKRQSYDKHGTAFTKMYLDTSTSAQHMYRYRITTANANGSGTATSNYVYMTPPPPADVDANQRNLNETKMTVTVTPPSNSFAMASTIELQYRYANDTWMKVGSYDYAYNFSKVHDPGMGKWQYRARYKGPTGLLSDYTASAVEPTYSGGAPKSVTAARASDSKVSVAVKADGVTDQNMREGFRLYLREVKPTYSNGLFSGTRIDDRSLPALMSWADASESSVSFSKDVTSWRSFGDMSGKCRVFSACTYYGDGESDDAYSNRVYGKLVAPSSVGVSKNGTTIYASCSMPSENEYPYYPRYGFKTSSDSDYEWHSGTIKSGVSLTSEKYTLNPCTVAVQLVPIPSLCPDMGDDVSAYRSDTATASVLKSPRPIDADSITVYSGDEGSSKSQRKIRFEPSLGDDGVEFATSYLVTVSRDGIIVDAQSISTSALSGGEYESRLFDASSDSGVHIAVKTVYAYSSGETYLSDEAGIDYTCDPDKLEAPKIIDVSNISDEDEIYRIRFEPASGGYTYVNSRYGERGYRYAAYVDGERVDEQSPSQSEIICSSMMVGDLNHIDIPVFTSGNVRVQVAVIDAKSSVKLSNSIKVNNVAPRASVFAYGGESVSIEDCIIEGMPIAIKLGGGSTASVEGCVISHSSGGRYYDIGSSSGIFEMNNLYD